MSIDYDGRPSSTVNSTLDFHILNPFAEDDLPQESSCDVDVGEVWSIPIPDARRSRSNTSCMHPLRSAGLAPGPEDAGVTRPHLSRVLDVGTGTLVDAPPVATDYDSPSSAETEVLIHKVTSGDSLAGVSLKYGITLAELRRANHLWTSDSIHLRTHLYVPVDKATRLKPTPVDNLLSITPEEEVSGSTYTLPTSDEENNPQLVQPSNAETIRRVPASHLSFFPPPSVAKPVLPSVPSEQRIPTSTTIHHTRYTSHPSNSLTSLLTSLPIAASTRDTIMARISFDSVSSSFSDREIEEDAHELDDVSFSSSNHDLRNSLPMDSVSLVTPTGTRAPPLRGGEARNSSESSTLAHIRHLSSSPRSYIPPHPEIRTMQLEPSPEMQIPILSGRTSAHGRKNSAQQRDATVENAKTKT
ncbi:hypothetical protein H0H92_012163 [Tricholoma furcatifolium]|nr:hypothetical protein H0H92_012163 [Tricholoma furcatifolium]